MKTAAIVFLMFCLAVVGYAADASSSFTERCAPEFQKVTLCLPFVTAKAATPTTDCCGTINELKNTNPACICFFIQQIHNGTNDVIKSMGIQETRLLQLPSACKLVNASVSECPRLLNLPSNSSDAAIFTSNTTSAAVTAPETASPVAHTPDTVASGGFWQKPRSAGVLIVAGVALLESAPMGLVAFL